MKAAAPQLELQFRATSAQPDPIEERLDREFLRLTAPPPSPHDDAPIHIVDLFSGIGGLSLGALEGARRMGRAVELSLAVDREPAALDVLSKTFGTTVRRTSAADLRVLLASKLKARVQSGERELFADVPSGPLLCAGPPCQGDSALNNHSRHNDPRNDLYLAVARAAVLTDAQAVLVENVRSVGRDRREAMSRCAAALDRLGYLVSEFTLDLSHLGVPQTRIRHLLVATRSRPLVLAVPTFPKRTVAWAIDDILDPPAGNPLDLPSTPSATNQGRIDWLFDNDAYDLPNELRPLCHQTEHSYLSMYGRLRWDGPAQTITSGFGSMGQGRFVHPLRRRTLTPHEAARLQFLPDFVRLDLVRKRGLLAEMIGNVAPPRFAISVVQALLRQGLL
jgi:DNA (cytosine-5)-methyltransferase 1